MKKYSIIALVVILLTSSCQMSFEKRRYLKGYHIDVIESQKKDHLSIQRSSMSTIQCNKPVVKMVKEINIKKDLQQIAKVDIKTTKLVSLRFTNKSVEAKSTISIKKPIFSKGHQLLKTKQVKGDIAKQRKAIAWSMGVLFVGFLISGIVLAVLSFFSSTLLYIGIVCIVLAVACLAIFLWAILDRRCKKE